MPPTRNRTFLALFLAVLAFSLSVSATRRRPTRPDPPTQLDMHRSFAVTDTAILDGFSFERVMNTLVERSGVTGMTATRLVQQWFDTQNPRPGLAEADGPHCDDFMVNGEPSFNGFPRRCPTPEGKLAISQPFVPPKYEPLALINRFDLTPANGSNCGQYRIIYALTTKNFPLDRIHLIFEGVLPNPASSSGLAGCRPVAQFWADLSSVESISERRARLETFFFNGIPGFAPLIHPDHYSRAGGTIRSMHYTFGTIPPVGPRFYQFRLEKNCDGATCTLRMQPDILENMPLASLFDGQNQSPVAERFRQQFIHQVRTLAIRDVNGFFMNVPEEFLAAESDLGRAPFGAMSAFISGRFTPEGRRFNDAIQAELDQIGSTINPTELVTRAETQTCTGCHFVVGPIGDGLRWPFPWPFFQHLGEEFREPGEAGLRYAVSPAMRTSFIPHRMEILRQYLATGTTPARSADAPIGGGRDVH